MTNFQAIAQRNRVEEYFVAELETKSTEELRRFLASPWIASIFSPEAIEELYQELHQREASPLDRTEEYFIAELETKSTEELRRFLASPWVASILSPEAIEELYQELHQREASPLDGTEEYFVGMGQD